ncbi:hypothetical protein DNTS_016630 [Danionella cerebrum]|uniref:Peroxisomal membrane protein PEX14 n=1 Tax=Danionella cerebrum TaxID=2873325 RepID=A0A553R8G6_9TELE|nr:hypothetical protein DNTS_016630 [Danionella translucida]
MFLGEYCNSSEVSTKPASSAEPLGNQKRILEEKRLPPVANSLCSEVQDVTTGVSTFIQAKKSSIIPDVNNKKFASTVMPEGDDQGLQANDVVINYSLAPPRSIWNGGLTDEEVDLAIQRSGSTEQPLTVAAPGPVHIAHPAPLAPYSPPGYRWRDYSALAVILAGIAFGFHHLYRNLCPWLEIRVPGVNALSAVMSEEQPTSATICPLFLLLYIAPAIQHTVNRAHSSLLINYPTTDALHKQATLYSTQLFTKCSVNLTIDELFVSLGRRIKQFNYHSLDLPNGVAPWNAPIVGIIPLSRRLKSPPGFTLVSSFESSLGVIPEDIPISRPLELPPWNHPFELSHGVPLRSYSLETAPAKYILPLIMGSKEDKKHLQRIESNIAEMSGTLTQTGEEYQAGCQRGILCSSVLPPPPPSAFPLRSRFTQLQMTLASVQELLVQQQKKIQELTQELANSQASSATNRMLESQSISELKAEIVSLKGLLLSRRQFPASPSIPKIPSWQIPLKPGSLSNPPSANHTNSSSDISPVSNESSSSSPVKESSSTQAITSASLCLNGDPVLPLDLKDQVRMEVQGEEEKREEDDEDEDDDDVTHADEDVHLSVQTEDRRGGDGQINEQVEKLRRPEGASNESEVD